MPRKKVLPPTLPPIEAYARLTSGIEWVCPDCGKVNKYTPIRYRRPRIVCKNEKCEHSFLIGVVVGKIDETGIPPGNTRVVARKGYNNKILNRRVPPEGGQGWARARGGMFWLCDCCGAWAYDHPDWDTGVVTCKICQTMRGTGVILYHGFSGPQPGSPWDWTPPRGFYVPRREGQGVRVFEEAGLGAGEDGGSTRSVGEAAEAGNEGAR